MKWFSVKSDPVLYLLGFFCLSGSIVPKLLLMRIKQRSCPFHNIMRDHCIRFSTKQFQTLTYIRKSWYLDNLQNKKYYKMNKTSRRSTRRFNYMWKYSPYASISFWRSHKMGLLDQNIFSITFQNISTQ